VSGRHDRGRRLTRAAALGVVALAVVLVTAARPAFATGLAGRLATDDPRALDAAITAIERAPASAPDLADARFAAAQACETRLADPVRALALYARVVHDFPDARVAIAAARRAEQLRAQIGATGGPEAAAFAKLVAEADRLTPEDVTRHADDLAAAAWPGAPDAALWLAAYLQRSRRFAEADARYAMVGTRWPGTRQAASAARGRAGNAIDAHAWDRAEQLATALDADAADRAIRDEVVRAAAAGRARSRRYMAAWIALVLVALGLAGSLAEASLRGGAHRPVLRPPLEILFLAPIAAVIVGASFTANQAIAPAVLRISIAGVALAWLSGATLDTLRARGRAFRARAIVHVVLCAIGVVAIGYIAITRDNLLDLLAETVKFGPGN
jgi:hypothetical protein